MRKLLAETGVFLRATYLQYVALFQWASIRGYVAYKVILPVTQILFFVELGVYATGRQNALYFALGNALQLTANAGIFGVIATVANERQYGTLPILLASPSNRLVTFLSRAIVNVIDGIVTVAVGLAIAVLLFGLDLHHANFALLAFCVVVISLTTAGLGLMFGSIGLVMRDAIIIANVVYYVLLIVCGINFPVSRLPGVVQVISYALPLTRGVQAARDAAAGASFGQVIGLVAGELLVGVLWALAGYVLFRLLEGWARRGGLQEAY
ncbi:MAG TPA: ABC transporter permease [Candidatus Dormibacteraeota bacterium]|nr:ABC transporter permease [Candidatus Dormibacteraeota bacterium]